MSEPSSTSKELRAFAQAATPSGEYGSYTNRHMQVSVPLESLIALLDETDAHAEAAAETANDRDSARTELAELEREVERLRAEARDNYQRRLDAADAAIIQAVDAVLQGGKAIDAPLDISAEWARVIRAIRILVLQHGEYDCMLRDILATCDDSARASVGKDAPLRAVQRLKADLTRLRPVVEIVRPALLKLDAYITCRLQEEEHAMNTCEDDRELARIQAQRIRTQRDEEQCDTWLSTAEQGSD